METAEQLEKKISEAIKLPPVALRYFKDPCPEKLLQLLHSVNCPADFRVRGNGWDIGIKKEHSNYIVSKLLGEGDHSFVIVYWPLESDWMERQKRIPVIHGRFKITPKTCLTWFRQESVIVTSEDSFKLDSKKVSRKWILQNIMFRRNYRKTEFSYYKTLSGTVLLDKVTEIWGIALGDMLMKVHRDPVSKHIWLVTPALEKIILLKSGEIKNRCIKLNNELKKANSMNWRKTK